MDEIRTPPSSYFSSGSRAPRASTSHLISLRLSDELMRRLAEVGNHEGLAMGDTIRLVLERGLGAKRNPKTRETAMNDTARPCTSTSYSTAPGECNR